MASEQRRGKLCHSISIQSTYFVCQLSVENIRVFIFVSVTPLYSSGGPFNMAAVGFSFPKIDAQSSPIFEISGYKAQKSFELLRSSNKSWAPLNPMMKPRSEASSFFYESQMVVTGGYICSGRSTDSVERMNNQDKPGHWMDFPVNLHGKTLGHKVVCYDVQARIQLNI